MARAGAHPVANARDGEMLRIRMVLLESEGRCETWQPPHLVWACPRSLLGFPKIGGNNKGSFVKVNEEERRPL